MDITLRVAKAMARSCQIIGNDYPSINCGGCAVFAVELNRRLMANGFNNGRFIVYDFALNGRKRFADINSAEMELRGINADIGDIFKWNDAGVFFDHVVLEWNGTAWDAEGPMAFSDMSVWYDSPAHDGFLSHEVVAGLADIPCNWNRTFDRDDIPYIQETLNEVFAKHKLRGV